MQEACSTSQAERDAQEESQELSAKVQHLVGLPNGEAVPQSILLVQVLQQLAVPRGTRWCSSSALRPAPPAAPSLYGCAETLG